MQLVPEDGRPPRLIRLADASEFPPDVVAMLDPKTNVVRIRRDVHEGLPEMQRHMLEKTNLPYTFAIVTRVG